MWRLVLFLGFGDREIAQLVLVCTADRAERVPAAALVGVKERSLSIFAFFAVHFKVLSFFACFMIFFDDFLPEKSVERRYRYYFTQCWTKKRSQYGGFEKFFYFVA